jgi:2-(1,2-epoxy-1,2-dihydrophenyl)acetyl-CoA isomerase
MTDNTITLSRDGDVAIVTIESPATLNALSAGSARHLSQILDQAAEEFRAILLTGSGPKAFCTGADLSSTPDAHWIDANGRLDSSLSIQEVFNPLATRLRNLRVPIVTAVCGAAAGFGCTLALLGDMVVAGQSAYFMQAFGRIGLVPDGGSTYVLTRLLGKARAMEMVLMGGKIPSAQALEWGLINRVVPDSEVLSTATQIARELAKGPYSMRLIRQLIWEGLDATWHEQVHRESLAQREAAFSVDFAEGVAAFKEKRAPHFKGQ